MSKTDVKKRVFFKDKLGNIYTHYINGTIKEDMVAIPYVGVTCPCCNQVSHIGASKEQLVSRLQEDNGFLCYFCFNTGNPHTNDSQVAATIYQQKDSIIHIIEQTGLAGRFNKTITQYSGEKEAKFNHWWNFLSIRASGENSQIILSLQDGGVTYDYTLRQWTTRLNSKLRQTEDSFKVDSNASRGIKESQHLQRLQKIHPNGIILDLQPSKSLSTMHCGKTSIIGIFEITHPNFKMDVSKTQRKIDELGDNACCCIICAEETAKKTPSTEKTIELANTMWRYNAAKVATALEHSDISMASVCFQNQNDEKLDTTSTKLVFKCHNPLHDPIVDTYSNRLNLKRGGYCTQCLHEAREFVGQSFSLSDK